MQTITLSLIEPESPVSPASLQADRQPNNRRLPRVERLTRSGSLLHPSPLGTNGDVLSLNIALGCVHRCAFCCTRANPSYPGDDVVYLHTNTAARLATELSGRRKRPRAVYLSPATDPFPPLAEVQDETARVVAVLAEHGVEAWLMTRGYIRPAALRVLEEHRERVKVTIGLTTLNRNLNRMLEPLAAPPRLRLRQLVELRKRGIRAQVALDPLVPGLTDTRTNLLEVLEALAECGVQHVTASYLFLRPGIQDHLVRTLGPHGWDELVLQEFTKGPVLPSATLAPARYLPRARRQRGYAALMSLAAGLGMTVSVSALTNPDFQRPQRQAVGS